jgi:hypothetical protein
MPLLSALQSKDKEGREKQGGKFSLLTGRPENEGRKGDAGKKLS